MKLKKIIIQGFKSFADRTVIDFHEGITGIVGPNGCGKSNISDAFRWVMGEQSAKSMRGEKMYDVIFSGTSKRKPLNLAEVTLVFDEVGDALAVDYEEVAITRRIFRSGEAKYLLNGHTVRLRDIHDLLLDAGLGKGAFSIFEQGKIDQIIQLPPLERRYIFEDAAGILRFLQRKREACRKLSQVEQNMARVLDIHAEVEKQIKVLERQAEEAKIFKENRAELETLEKALLCTKCERLKKKIETITEKEQALSSQLQKVNEKISFYEEKIKKERADLNGFELALREHREKVYEKKSQKEIKAKELEGAQERVFELEKKIKEIDQALLTCKEFEEKKKQQVQKQKDELEQEKESLESIEKELEEKKQEVKRNQETVKELREQHDRIQKQRFEIVQNEKRIEIELQQSKIRLENNFEKIRSLKEEEKILKEQKESLLQKKQSDEKELSLLKESLEKNFSLMDQEKERLDKLKEEIEDQIAKKELVNREKAEALARLKVLLRFREDMEGFSSSARTLLEESNRSDSPLYGKIKALYELVEAEKGYEKALSTALKTYMHTLVVSSFDDLDLVLKYIQDHKLSDISLVCQENIDSSNETDTFLHSLLDKVVKHPITEKLLKKVYLAENAKEGFDLLKKEKGISVWTKENIFIDPNGVLFLSKQEENNVFIREAEIKSLQKQIDKLSKESQVFEGLLEKLSEEQNECIDKKKSLDEHIFQQERKISEIAFDLKRVAQDIDKLDEKVQKIQIEEEKLKEENQKFLKEQEQSRAQHESTSEKVLELQQQAQAIEKQLQQSQEQFKEEQADLLEKETKLKQQVAQYREKEKEVDLLYLDLEKNSAENKRLKEEKQRTVDQIEHLKEKIQEIREQIDLCVKVLEEVESGSTEFEETVKKKKEIIETLEQELKQEREKIKDTEKNHTEVAINLAKQKSTFEAYEQEIKQHYEMDFKEVEKLNLHLEMPIDQAEKKVRQLRRKVENAGDINMTSIEEYDTHKKRYEFLSEQLNDLTKSKDQLVQIIDELDTKSRKLFKETFESVREKFRKNFKTLFEGGEADLAFTDSEDILEAGVEIIAKPPGKQMRSISLLSGGEKCLTAMALLFSIFEIKPSPFCFLDEIDAPLDDINVGRFLNVVKQFLDRSQFIIITHNKRTMNICDILYGVTMEEKGVSKMLSIEMEKKEEVELSLVN